MFMHRKKVILGWVVILAVAIAGGPSLAATYTADYSTPARTPRRRPTAPSSGQSAYPVCTATRWETPNQLAQG
jgi:hypothetical protein